MVEDPPHYLSCLLSGAQLQTHSLSQELAPPAERHRHLRSEQIEATSGLGKGP
jgi:hypothetical protein